MTARTETCAECEEWRKSYNAAVANGLSGEARMLGRRIAAHERNHLPARSGPWAELRAALEAGPTPGPWYERGDSIYYQTTVSTEKLADNNFGGDAGVVRVNTIGRHGRWSIDRAYIAAVDPSTIKALLDRVEALERVREAAEKLLRIDPADPLGGVSGSEAMAGQMAPYEVWDNALGDLQEAVAEVGGAK